MMKNTNDVFKDTKFTRGIEGMYMTPDVIMQREKSFQMLGLSNGEKVLDIGVGPGFLSAAMGTMVGSEGEVYGIDMSEDMLGMAKMRCNDKPWVHIKAGNAIKLPFEAESFDAIMASQVYELVSDVNEALNEMHRVLRKNGRALILDSDWDSLAWHSQDKDLMDKILTSWKTHYGDPILPRTLSTKLIKKGFKIEQIEIFPILNLKLTSNNFSYWLVKLINDLVPGRKGVTKKDVELWTKKLYDLDSKGEYFFNINRYLFLVRKN